MITVTIFEKEGKLTGFKVKGHAGYAEYGEDIVCSAVSVLALNTCNSVSELTDDKAELKYDESKTGIISIHIDEPSECAELLLKSFELGINSVKNEYGKFLKVEYQTK